MAAVIAVLLMTGGLLMAWRPWEKRQPAASSAEPRGPSTSMARVPEPILTSTTIPPPPPPVFSAKSIDRVLLTADQLSKILGIAVSNDPSASGGGSALAMNSSSYGTSDHSGQVKPRSCVGVAFTGEHDVYGGGDSAEIKTQTFGNLYRSSSTRGPYLLQQTAVVFPSAEQAQGFVTSSQSQWDSCTKTEVDVVLGYENGRGYTLGDVQRRGDLLTVSMASNGALSGAEGCQQVLGVRENVVVETRSCNGVGESANTNYDLAKQRWPSDPSWAANYAERVATAMLNNVTT